MNRPTTDNLESYKMSRAMARRTFRAAKKQSWQNFVSGLNSRITAKKAWDMIRKIRGRGSQSTINHLMTNNVLVTDVKDITNTLGETFSSNSSTNHYTTEFQQYKQTQEKNTINFKSKTLKHTIFLLLRRSCKKQLKTLTTPLLGQMTYITSSLNIFLKRPSNFYYIH